MISIIIPVYNAEKYLEKCLLSILNQGDVETEIICVDDGSVDNSKSVVLRLQSQYNNIQYYYQNNAGAPTARNNGFLKAKGEYCMFFDADDVLMPGALNEMYGLARENDADLVIGDYCEIDADDKQVGSINLKNFGVKSQNSWSFACCPPLPGNKLIKQSVIEKNNVIFDDVKIGQDLGFYLKLISACKKCEYFPKNVMGYRILEGSISRQYTLRILDICKSIDHVRKYYNDRGLSSQYKTYIEVAELIAYRSQLEKVPRIANTEDRAKAIEVLSDRCDSLKFDMHRHSLRFLKEKLKTRRLLTTYKIDKDKK